MELIFEFLFQFFGELILQVLFELGFRSLVEPFRQSDRNEYLAGFGYLMLGVVAGGLSLFLLPQHLTPNVQVRVINLLVTPFAVGGLMNLLGNIREKREISRFRMDKFLFGFLFALAMTIVRFVFAK